MFFPPEFQIKWALPHWIVLFLFFSVFSSAGLSWKKNNNQTKPYTATYTAECHWRMVFIGRNSTQPQRKALLTPSAHENLFVIAGELDSMTFKGPFQLKQFYDSMHWEEWDLMGQRWAVGLVLVLSFQKNYLLHLPAWSELGEECWAWMADEAPRDRWEHGAELGQQGEREWHQAALKGVQVGY